jgi:tripartite-type tricarboxylate transporter receptor subunit TctC
MDRRAILKCGLAGLGAAAWGPSPGLAQDRYPDRPVKLIVPFSPGGATDVVGRLWADRVKPVLGTVVVENRASGGGSLGTSEVAHASPNGYTFLFGNTSTQVLLPVLMSKPPYDPIKDFASIYLLCNAPIVVVVHESVPVHTLKELIAYARTNPGKLSYGSAGTGTLTNLAGELFKQLIHVPDIVHVPYKGAAPGVRDLAAGQIPMMTPNIGGPLLQFHRAGKVRILAVASETRLKIAPDIPTTAEAGLPGMIAGNFNGLFAPAGVPKSVIDMVAEGTSKAAAADDFQQLLVKSGFEPMALGPAKTQAFIKSELERWTPIIKATNFKM